MYSDSTNNNYYCITAIDVDDNFGHGTYAFLEMEDEKTTTEFKRTPR